MKRQFRPLFVLGMAFLIAYAAACSDTTGTDSTGTDSTQGGVTVSRSDFGAEWPLTVESGELSCAGPLQGVYFTTGGTRYAVNGSARTAGDAPDIDPIWADDPDNPSLKKNIGVLIDRGLQICEQGG